MNLMLRSLCMGLLLNGLDFPKWPPEELSYEYKLEITIKIQACGAGLFKAWAKARLGLARL